MSNLFGRLLVVLVLLTALSGLLAWFKLGHVVAQPSWITSDMQNRYFYGSVGTTDSTGLPYWMWLAMPRIFPEHMPGPGGYAALGLSWEEGREMPIGFAKQRMGYIRVTGNCALCHVISRSTGQDQAPAIVPVVDGQTTGIQPLLMFYKQCAHDPRFNADEFFAEINSDTRLSFSDKLLYRYVLIPRMKRALIDDPAKVLFSTELRAHARDPKSGEPLSAPEMNEVENWMRDQSRTAKQ